MARDLWLVHRFPVNWRLRHLPWLLLTSSGLLVLAAGIGYLLRGTPGAVGAAAGVGVVMVSYTFSILLIAWGDSVDPGLVLPFGLAAYVIKFTLIGVVMAAVADSGWPGLQPMGVGVVAGVVAWSGVHIWWVIRHAPRSVADAQGSGPAEERSPNVTGTTLRSSHPTSEDEE